MSITPALYIVRKHDKHKKWELPTYFNSNTRGPWLEGHFIHASASTMMEEEAKRVLDRFPGSVMLRVG